MVRAILDGRWKTQTRRIVKPQPSHALVEGNTLNDEGRIYTCPYGQPGDRLIVKENVWMFCEKVPNGKTKKGNPKFKYVPVREAGVIYRADHPEKPTLEFHCPRMRHSKNKWGWRMKVGRFMPCWASRITLEITNVRVERLQDISEEDALAEGVEPYTPHVTGMLNNREQELPSHAYKTLWESINSKGSWSANPWVWVLEFRKL